MCQTVQIPVKQDDVFYQALRVLPQAIWIVDGDFQLVFMNVKGSHLQEDSNLSLGKSVLDVVLTPEEDTRFIDALHEVMIDQTEKSVQRCCLSGQGEKTLWNILLSPIRLSEEKSQKPLILLAFEKLNEQQVKLERTLKQAYHLERIIHSIGGPLVVFDQEARKVHANPSFISLIGDVIYDSVSILSEEIKSQFEYYDFRDKVIRTEELPVSLAIKGEYVTNYELKLIHKKTGAESYYLCSTSPLHIDHTDSQYNILTMMDVSAENRDEKNRRDFIQIAAHELRTPLTSIKGFTQLVLERYREREMKWFFQPTLKLMQEIDRDQTFFKVILDEAIRLDELTNELLSIFKMDQGKFDMNLQVYDISLIAEEALDEFIIPNEFHHIQYTNHLSEAYVYADVKQIKRVIHNLISNAVKYAPHHPNICIVLDQHQGAIRFSVQDQGIGIPEEQQARLFERFFRAHTDEHEGIHGFGVGLHICQEIMRQHGGQISFTSKYGEGSTFYFELPIYPVSNLT